MQNAKNRRQSSGSVQRKRAVGGNRGGNSSNKSGPERLQKVLAAAGIASRRQCEKLILEGRVEVDQQVVTKLGTKVELAEQTVCVDGVPLVQSQQVYYMINKPKGVVCTHRDPAGRMRIVDLVPEESARMFSVGRLDRESEGLILLTNDGGLAQKLAHPRYGVEKIYHVQVAGLPDRTILQRLREGVQLAEGKVAVAGVRMKRAHKQSTVLEIKLREGKNREIRRLLAALGHKVQRLKRVGLGPLKLGTLPQGEARPLEQGELTALNHLVSDEKKSSRKDRPDPKKASKRNRLHSENSNGRTGSRVKKSNPRKSKTRPLRSKKS